MSASWVAASVRARLLSNRRIGRARALALARGTGWPEAIQAIAVSPYGEDLTLDASLEDAQRKVAATLLWNTRLVAGWLPPGGSQALQPLAAWFELANVEERLAYLGGGARPVPYELGSLATAWDAVSRATTVDAVRDALAASRWGDPGTSEPAAMMLTLRFRLAAWVATAAPGADVWAATASVLLAARVLFAPGASLALPSAPARPYGLPPRWREAASLGDLAAMLPRATATILEGIAEPADMWRAEARWWSRLAADANATLVRAGFGPDVVVASVALLAYDAWLARAALGAAARGEPGRSVFDAVA